MEGDTQAAADSTASKPNEPTPPQAPPIQDTASLLNNDEMEDLFGPGTGKTTDTSMSTPAYPGTLQTQQDQAIAVTEAQQEQSSHSEQPSFIASLAAPALPTSLSSSSQGNDNNLLPSAPARAADQAASMFDFGNIGPSDNGSSALPDTNFDFSHMTSDDFNSLLASLGASGGGDGQINNGNDLLSGLNLGKHFTVLCERCNQLSQDHL